MARDQAPRSSMASTIKAYSVPIVLFSIAIFYQLFVLPRSFPPSHYDVLGIERHSSIALVKEAYESFSSKWNSGAEIPSTIDFIKIQYAYELLSNPFLKRDYDTFGIDEQLHVLENIKRQYAGESFSSVELPLLNASPSDPRDLAFNVITMKDFQSLFNNSHSWLLQVYSLGSDRCAQFSTAWKTIATLLDGVAKNAMVELGDVHLATLLAERKMIGQVFFRNGLPSLVAFPPSCNSLDCFIRYEGDLTVDAVMDWFATSVLNLPRIYYYPKESLGEKFLAKSGPHKVKVIFFSKTGERATPFVRQTAKNYWAYASFAFVQWRLEDSSVWWNTFNVESAPALVFLKDPGVKPIVYHGPINNSRLLDIMEQNKQLELPQLRSVSTMQLGCDARGHSPAGNDTIPWYCVVLAGRQSLELNKMRETMCRIKEIMSSDSELNEADKDQTLASAAFALREKRLTFSWLDGEAQKSYCSFYVQSASNYETCGPRRTMIDVPRLYIVRYKRNSSEANITVKRKPKHIWDGLLDEDVDPVSQLVVTYNGSVEIPQIMQWISEIIRDGDTRDLPFYRAKTPELVPEDSEPNWSSGVQRIKIKQRILSILSANYDLLGDPRVGPSLLLAALLSFGTIWLTRSQPRHPREPSQPGQSTNQDEIRPQVRERRRNTSSKNTPPSITDPEPKDAYQMPLPDSDSE
ncbi:dnaJ subfamily C member 16-like isoform X1 [Tripterygium wilfordii]|uniref:DnaJ subfamily C member 16-like isoform X1 n=1 Tax=Tripterygium wilfordii TaxID=458696 RepID=A0A7J7C8A2_TRIWF|nr:uncharacterized protein LOC119987192 [Tripterygium wilfordii]KAF5730165.1 dnaJ subfamily C member 16-like isoform X1 [Tripterygium wilfordii]